MKLYGIDSDLEQHQCFLFLERNMYLSFQVFVFSFDYFKTFNLMLVFLPFTDSLPVSVHIVFIHILVNGES